MKNQFLAIAAICVLGTSFSSCKKSKSDPAPLGNGKVEFVNFAAGRTGVDVYVADVKKASLTYGQNSGYQTYQEGGKTVKFNELNALTQLATASVSVGANRNYTVFAIPNSAQNGVEAFTVEDSITGGVSSQAYFRFINLIPDANSYDLAQNGTEFISGLPSRAFKSRTKFISTVPKSFNFTLLDGSRTSLATNSITLEAGKYYTVAAIGLPSGTDPNNIKLQVITHQ